MRDRDYYPAGAYGDPNAPYNQSDPPEIEVEVEVKEVMTKESSIITTNAWYVTDEEGYTELEDSNLNVYDEYSKQNRSLYDILAAAKEEISKIRKEAEERQLKLEAHYGVRHNSIPGYYLPDIPEDERSWHVNRRQVLGDAMKRVEFLKALEEDLDGWDTKETEIERI